MRSRYRVLEPDQAQFVTATIVNWLPVFTTSDCCDILAAELQHCRLDKGLLVYAWVIMDNHFHAIVKCADAAKVLGERKRFTAHKLIPQLQQEGRDWLLQQLAYWRAPYKRNSTYQVWQEGIHPKAIMDDETMLQKIEYIHNNPVKRGLVAAPEHWRYSSAHEWLPAAIPAFRCDAWR